jgi:hypothetical protein
VCSPTCEFCFSTVSPFPRTIWHMSVKTNHQL